ncbi:MAG: DNA topoisomerase IB [Casimicrobiaceae bacterium]
MASAAGLLYVSDADPGIARIRRGDRFTYLHANRRPVRDNATLQRIAALAIPPAYEEVWICPHANGHLQATGHDARRRKQYRYHAQWRAVRDDAKFDRMIAFGEALPRLRRLLRRDLALPGLPRAKVLAVIVSLLDVTSVRIGNESYVRDNRSYGLTTLRNRHAAFVRDGRARLTFRGKGGIEHEVAIDDRRLAKIVRRCQQLPGQMLFQYLDDTGERRPVTSDLVNEYLKEATGADFTAKDFRTWIATVRAFTLLAGTPLPENASEAALKSCIVAAIRQVASELRNTPAVCRKSYINPVVFDAWRDGSLQGESYARLSAAPRRAEATALSFLRAQARSARRSGAKVQARGTAATRPQRRSSAAATALSAGP